MVRAKNKHSPQPTAPRAGVTKAKPKDGVSLTVREIYHILAKPGFAKELGRGKKTVSRARLHARIAEMMAQRINCAWRKEQTWKIVKYRRRQTASNNSPASTYRHKQLLRAYHADAIPVDLLSARWRILAKEKK